MSIYMYIHTTDMRGVGHHNEVISAVKLFVLAPSRNTIVYICIFMYTFMYICIYMCL